MSCIIRCSNQLQCTTVWFWGCVQKLDIIWWNKLIYKVRLNSESNFYLYGVIWNKWWRLQLNSVFQPCSWFIYLCSDDMYFDGHLYVNCITMLGSAVIETLIFSLFETLERCWWFFIYRKNSCPVSSSEKFHCNKNEDASGYSIKVILLLASRILVCHPRARELSVCWFRFLTEVSWVV